MDDVLFIGCGRTARAIAERLVSLDSVGSVYLNSRTRRSADSLARSLRRGTDKPIHVTLDVREMDLPKYTLISLSNMPETYWWADIRSCRYTRESRHGEVIHNFGSVLALGDSLKGRLDGKVVIDITNPVDDFTNLLQEVLETKRVYGFGMEIDVARYGKVVGGSPLCIGMHGEATPVMGWGRKELYESAYELMDRELLEHVRKSGIPYDACGREFREFFRKLSGDEEEVVTMSTYLDSEFAGVMGTSLSVPVRVRNGEVLGHPDMEINDVEQELFKGHSTTLRNVYMAQLWELKRSYSQSRR